MKAAPITEGAARARGRPPRHSVRRLVLVGFMGAGKSTVGPLLAEAVGWEFADLDELVAREAGIDVPAVIRRHGLAGFRHIESRIGRELLRRSEVVIAVGGGWPAEPGHMCLLGPETLSVWLVVDPATAVARVGGSSTARPLLETADPHDTARALVRRRRRHYSRADFAVDTEDRSPGEVVARILDRLRATPLALKGQLADAPGPAAQARPPETPSAGPARSAEPTGSAALAQAAATHGSPVAAGSTTSTQPPDGEEGAT